MPSSFIVIKKKNTVLVSTAMWFYKIDKCEVDYLENFDALEV